MILSNWFINKNSSNVYYKFNKRYYELKDGKLIMAPVHVVHYYEELTGNSLKEVEEQLILEKL